MLVLGAQSFSTCGHAVACYATEYRSRQNLTQAQGSLACLFPSADHNRSQLTEGRNCLVHRSVFLASPAKQITLNRKQVNFLATQAQRLDRTYSRSTPSCTPTNVVNGIPSVVSNTGLEENSHSEDVESPCPEVEAFNTVRAIHEAAVVACIRSESTLLALAAARSALDGGVSVLEITLTTPSATEVIRALVTEYPHATIGAGTVVSLEGAELAVKAGARFLMSPVTDPELVRFYRAGPTVVIPGAMTPTEVFAAAKLGARMVKVFPIGSAGGVGFVRAMQRAMPGVFLIPAHQMTLDLVEPYISAGSSAVVLSDAIFERQAMAARDFATISRLASVATSLGRQARISSQHFC